MKQSFKTLAILFIVLCVAQPTFAKTSELSIVLGCPTDKSIVASILSAENIDGYIEYGTSSGKYTNKTEAVSMSAGKPASIVLSKLQPNTQYFYRLNCKKKQGDSSSVQPEYSFHTVDPRAVVFALSCRPIRISMSNPALSFIKERWPMSFRKSLTLSLTSGHIYV